LSLAILKPKEILLSATEQVASKSYPQLSRSPANVVADADLTAFSNLLHNTYEYNIHLFLK
jgi:hypothetical protein